jgi:Raf kinase inhibitor-like YbhB/YbcL family protein
MVGADRAVVVSHGLEGHSRIWVTRREIMREGHAKNIYLIFIFIIIILMLPFAKAKGGTMELTSSAFGEGGMIPNKYTCDGADVSPPLKWGSIPDATKSFALICDDPDAPVGTWVHWVYYDIPAKIRDLPENVTPDERPASGGVQGINDFRRIGYGGPCPPGGTHRYLFKLYALDTLLNLSPGATKNQVLKAMENHVVDHVQLMGKYRR